MKHKNKGQKNKSVQNKNKLEGLSRFKKINLRTMNSDKDSIKQQGGGEPNPYTPNELEQDKNQTPLQDLSQQDAQKENEIQNQSFENKPSQDFKKEDFPPTNENQGGNKDIFPPQPINQEGEESPKKNGGEVKPIKKKGGNKKMFIGLLIAIIIIAILIAGYLFVWPMFSNTDDTNTDENTDINTENPVDTNENDNEEDFEVPTVPTEQNEGEEKSDNTTSTDADTIPEGEEKLNKISADSHQSLFMSPVDSVVKKVVFPVNVNNINEALKISSTEVPLFREMVLTDKEENILQTNKLLDVLIPDISLNVKNNFQSDPTVYTYTDSSGTWFGMILKSKSSIDVAQLKTEIAKIEDNTNVIKNFFLTKVGNKSSWKDGGAGNVVSRYLSFGNGNASFNYGWSNDLLIISTSYTSFKEVVSKI